MRAHLLKLVPTHWFGLILMGFMAWAVPTVWLSMPDPASIHWGVGMGIAFALMLLALVPAGYSKNSPRLARLSYFLNALGTGCSVGTLFAQMEEIPDFTLLLSVLVPGAVLVLILALILCFPDILWAKRLCRTAFWLSLLMILLGILDWFTGEGILGSLSFFGGLVLLPFSVVCRTSVNKPEDAPGHLAISGFGIFLVVFFVVLLILSEGDILDGLDFDWPSRKKTTKP